MVVSWCDGWLKCETYCYVCIYALVHGWIWDLDENKWEALIALGSALKPLPAFEVRLSHLEVRWKGCRSCRCGWWLRLEREVIWHMSFLNEKGGFTYMYEILKSDIPHLELMRLTLATFEVAAIDVWGWRKKQDWPLKMIKWKI